MYLRTSPDNISLWWDVDDEIVYIPPQKEYPE
jgi:hypothetical protein